MISTSEMKVLEDNCGIPKDTLMENAGKGIFEVMNKKFNIGNKKVLVVCYHGNNGGDGFVAANLLADIAAVDVLFLGDETKMKPEAEKQYEKMLNNILIQVMADYEFDFNDYDYIIDALLGTGTNGALIEPLGTIVDLINSSKSKKIAVDIPTGLNPDTGEVFDKVVNADLIVTFHDLKKGLEKFKDKTEIIDIGIKK